MSGLTVRRTPIEGLLVFDIPLHGDARGWFKENWQRAKMLELGLPDFGPVSQDRAAVALLKQCGAYELIRLGREIKWALNDHPAAQLEDARLSGVYGTILVDDLGRTESGPWQRNVTVFADGEVDRSPCGSGTAARVALLSHTGDLADHETLTHDSIIGTRLRPPSSFTHWAPARISDAALRTVSAEDTW